MPLSIPKVDDPVLGRVVPSDTLESAAAAGTFLVPLVFMYLPKRSFALSLPNLSWSFLLRN